MRKLLGAVVGVTALLGLSVVSAGSADAVTCGAHSVCVYQNINFGGGSYVWIENDLDPNFNAGTPITFSNGVKVNDNISSLINNTAKTVEFCTNANFAGTCYTFAPGYAFTSVPQNDTYSCVKFI